MLSIAWILTLIAVTTARTIRFEIGGEDSFEAWSAYKTAFKKSYDSPEEEERRFKTWQRNAKLIEEHNWRAALGQVSFRLALNQFADLTNEQFRARLLGDRVTRADSHGSHFLPAMNVAIPPALDWRKAGFVTGVKRQWQCYGSWAFSATGALEGQFFRQSGALVSLSEQQLIDCSRRFGNDGCVSGSASAAFEFVTATGIETEANYPYTATTNNCTQNETMTAVRIRGYATIKEKSEGDLLNAVATVGPVSVAVDAGSLAFQFYSGGVLNDTKCSMHDLNQAMLVVGYGVLKGQPYWLVKNSWDVTWGLKGYIMMARNASNQCGIASKALFPLA